MKSCVRRIWWPIALLLLYAVSNALDQVLLLSFCLLASRMLHEEQAEEFGLLLTLYTEDVFDEQGQQVWHKKTVLKLFTGPEFKAESGSPEEQVIDFYIQHV